MGSTKTLLFALCLLLVAVSVNSSTLLSGRGFQTTQISRGFVHDETAQNEEDRSIGKNNGDVIKFLKWKSKFMDCLEKHI